MNALYILPDTHRLKTTLDTFIENFQYRARLEHDPIWFVRGCPRDEDREIAALFAAVFAYGNVAQILGTLRQLFSLMDPGPYPFVMGFSSSDAARFRRFYHRFNTGRDVIALCLALRKTLEEFGSLQNLFVAGNDAQALTIELGLSTFVQNLLRRVPAQVYRRRSLPASAGVRFLLSSPASGSACKRMNLFLRWMVRPGPIDFGLWKKVAPRQLVLPVDTHIARIGRYIGLTRRANMGWKTALDMTASLRTLNPQDPVRYDFALCHLGIMRGCPAKYNPAQCASCPIREVCTL
ncbi:MAG: TIGR02757 family protein [Acidobacteria bacterium]|nr:TIGR02757 family protein [Acidobacteriota bacterium]